MSRLDESLRLQAEAVAWWSRLTKSAPDQHFDTYTQERARLAKLYTEHGQGAAGRRGAIRAEQTAYSNLPELHHN